MANTAANTTLNIFFSAMSPSLAKYSIPHHRLLPDGELKVSAVLPSKDEFIADNVQVQLERVSARESHLTVKNDEYKIVAKSRMYPWADRNLKRKRLDLMISLVMDEKLIPVAPHGLIGQVLSAALHTQSCTLDRLTSHRSQLAVLMVVESWGETRRPRRHPYIC